MEGKTDMPLIISTDIDSHHLVAWMSIPQGTFEWV